MKTPDVLRHLPSVSDLLESPQLKGLIDRFNRNVVVGSARTFLDDLRRDLQRRAKDIPSISEITEALARRIIHGEQPMLRPVINATGILLHHGLGRAPLAEEAVESLVLAARDYSSVELNLSTGQPACRSESILALLAQLTGAEAALVVNNNAGATLLTLAALAAGRETIVSRAELIEIDGYRLSDMAVASGTVLREIGSTNRTRTEDYAEAINEKTALLLRVHTGNVRVVGPVQRPESSELVALARRHRVPLVDDLGSATLMDIGRVGGPELPVVSASLEAGADLVLLSGDKLMGGPQCGLILGRRALVDRLAKHPLARALRIDKLTLAALAATLQIYRDPQQAALRIPLLALLSTSVDNLKQRAERLAPQMAASPGVGSAEVIESFADLSDDSPPDQRLATWCIALTPREGTSEDLAKALRLGMPAVIGRIEQGRLLIDLRSVFPRQDQALVAAVEALK